MDCITNAIYISIREFSYNVLDDQSIMHTYKETSIYRIRQSQYDMFILRY